MLAYVLIIWCLNLLAQKEGCHLFDEVEFNSEAVQRVWQYLRRFNKDPRLIQEFYFDVERTEGSPKECLKTLIRFEFFPIWYYSSPCRLSTKGLKLVLQRDAKIHWFLPELWQNLLLPNCNSYVPFLTKMLTFGYSQLGFKDFICLIVWLNDFVSSVFRNCGVPNPSWSEIRYFVNFLNYQLRDCEQSVYCDPELIGDTLEGFRTFVVDFMIIMSKVSGKYIENATCNKQLAFIRCPIITFFPKSPSLLERSERSLLG